MGSDRGTEETRIWSGIDEERLRSRERQQLVFTRIADGDTDLGLEALQQCWFHRWQTPAVMRLREIVTMSVYERALASGTARAHVDFMFASTGIASCWSRRIVGRQRVLHVLDVDSDWRQRHESVSRQGELLVAVCGCDIADRDVRLHRGTWMQPIAWVQKAPAVIYNWKF
jgi:hypothetical protein